MEGGEVDDKEGEGDVGQFGEDEAGPERMEEAVKAKRREEREGLPGGPSGKEENEGVDLGAESTGVHSAEGIGDEVGGECAGERTEGIAEDIAKVGEAGGNGELERFKGKREEDEAADDEEKGPELSVGLLEGPLADEGGWEIEGEVDHSVLPVFGPDDAVPPEGLGDIEEAGEVPGEEREVDDSQEGQGQ